MKISYDTTQDTLAAVLAVTHAAFGVPVAQTNIQNIDGHAIDTSDLSSTNVNDAAGQTHADDTKTADVTQRDKDGLPWDVRVHSTPATMTEKGVWRAKRGRQDNEYAAVKAEYFGTAAAAALTTMQAPAGMKTPPTMAAPPAAQSPYQKLFAYLTEMTKQGRAPADWVKETLTDYGVADGNILNLQSADPKFVEELHDEFVKVLGE